MIQWKTSLHISLFCFIFFLFFYLLKKEVLTQFLSSSYTTDILTFYIILHSETLSFNIRWQLVKLAGIIEYCLCEILAVTILIRKK